MPSDQQGKTWQSWLQKSLISIVIEKLWNPCQSDNTKYTCDILFMGGEWRFFLGMVAFVFWEVFFLFFFLVFWCWLGALGSWGIEHLLGLAWNKLEGVAGEDAVPPPNACELRCNGCKLTGSYGSRVLVLLYLVDLLLLLLLLLTKTYKSKSSRRKNQQKQQQAARNKKLIPQTTPPKYPIPSLV